jgi:hypothetical protein
MNRVIKGIALSLYISAVLFFALIAFAMSFLSDGPVPLYVHIVMPLVVLAIFIGPVIVWRRLNAGPIPSPLPAKLQKYQDKIIVIFLIIWAVAVTMGYFRGQNR